MPDYAVYNSWSWEV